MNLATLLTVSFIAVGNIATASAQELELKWQNLQELLKGNSSDKVTSTKGEIIEIIDNFLPKDPVHFFDANIECQNDYKGLLNDCVIKVDYEINIIEEYSTLVRNDITLECEVDYSFKTKEDGDSESTAYLEDSPRLFINRTEGTIEENAEDFIFRDITIIDQRCEVR